MEHQLTPLELKALLPALESQLGFLGKLVASSVILNQLRHQEVETFVAADPYPGIRLFADPTVRKEDKALLIGFCDNLARLLIPTGHFLQYIPAGRFDVLVLADERDSGFETGAGAVRGTMPGWVRCIVQEFEVRRYRGVYCLGTSMGGFPALRAGSMLGAKRSVSVAGTLAWPMERLRAGTRSESFDQLCVCRPQSGDLILAYSSGHARDAAHATRMQRRIGARLVPIEAEGHNTFHELLKMGKLDVFLGSILDFEPKPLDRGAKLPPVPKPRKDLRHHVKRLLERLRFRVPEPTGFVRPAQDPDEHHRVL
jgi:hypothetical protein